MVIEHIITYGRRAVCLAVLCCLPWYALAADDAYGTNEAQDPELAKIKQQLEQIRELQQQRVQAQNYPNGVPPGMQDEDSAKPLPQIGQQKEPTKQKYQESEVAEKINDAAFSAMATQLLPLEPKQILRLQQMFNASQAAAAAPAGVPPRPTATSQLVNLAPGSTPPIVRLAQGFVSSVAFLDSSGEPWPIEAYSLGNPEAFNIVWNKKDNLLMIQANKLYTYGNLAVRLRGLSIPVMVTLVPGQKAVDYRVDMRVQGLGPNAKLPQGDSLPEAVNSELLAVLDGMPPEGGMMLQVDGAEAQAWQVGDVIFLRTPYSVLSPGWISTLSSADGTKVYKMQRTPLILVSVHGKVMQLKLKGL
jgi:intracellular multiplication protein IcmK